MNVNESPPKEPPEMCRTLDSNHALMKHCRSALTIATIRLRRELILSQLLINFFRVISHMSYTHVHIISFLSFLFCVFVCKSAHGSKFRVVPGSLSADQT